MEIALKLFFAIIILLWITYILANWNKETPPPQPKIHTEIVTTVRDTILDNNASLSTIIYENHKFVYFKNGKNSQLILIGKN